MQFLRLRNRAMAGLVESGLWKLISTNRAFFSGLYREPSGEPVPVVHFFSLLKMKGDYLQKNRTNCKTKRPLFDPELEEGTWFAAA